MTIDEVNKNIISLMYRSKDNFVKIINALKEEHFLDDYKVIFNGLVTYFQKYKEIPSLDEVPCGFYVKQGHPDIEWGINELKAFRKKNLLKEAVQKSAVHLGNNEVDKAAETLAKNLANLSLEDDENVCVCDTKKNLLYEYTDLVKRRKNGAKAKYYIPKLDELVDGIYEDELIILMGEPKVGKSIMSSYICYNNIKDKKNVLFFNMDQGKDLSITTFLSFDTGIDRSKLMRGDLTTEEKAIVVESIKRFTNDYGNIKIIDGSFDLSKIYNYSIANDADLIIVDQISNIIDKGRTYLEQAANNVRGLHGIKKKIKKPILAISQLNRDFSKDKEKEGDSTPKRQHIGFTDCIFQVADGVFGLYKDKDGNMILQIMGLRRVNNSNDKFRFKWNLPNITELDDEWYNEKDENLLNQFNEADWV